jgi:hypothetical protein
MHHQASMLLCCAALCCCCLQRELELIAEALRIPGSKSLGPVSRVRSNLLRQQSASSI